MNHNHYQQRNQGAMLVIAMMFLAIFGALAATMGLVAQGNLQGARTFEQGNRALSAAETGMNYITYRIAEQAQDIATDKGEIEGAVADALWNQLATALFTLGSETQFLDSDTHPKLIFDADNNPQRVELGRLPLGVSEFIETDNHKPTFQITIEQHPLMNSQGAIDLGVYDSAYYQRAPYNLGAGANKFTADGEAVSSTNPIQNKWLRVTVVGVDNDVQRTVQMDLRIDKKVRFAIVSRNRIMIGRNVMVKGSVGSRYTLTDYQHGHPVQMRDNFHGLNTELDGWLDDLVAYVGLSDMDGDNRINVQNNMEMANMDALGFADENGDGYIDTIDLFIKSYDSDANGIVDSEEFQQDGALVDAQLWHMVNELKYPPGTTFDWDNKRVMLPGSGIWTDAATDMNQLSAEDDYAKIHGQVIMKSTWWDWYNGAAGGAYQQFFRGPIIPEAFEAATTFQADDNTLGQFHPGDFDVSQYRDLATGSLADQVVDAVPVDSSQPTQYLPKEQGVTESVPYNSPYPYDYYKRPVYENMTFTNVTVPKGSNALFKNCKFVGVTFVDTETSNEDPNFNYAGMQEANGDLAYMNVDATIGEQDVADTKDYGNNVRFDGCTFEGVVVTEAPTAFTHVRNKLQFTGKTQFDLNAESLTSEQKRLFRKSTILAPQFSIDMGTFTDPDSPDEVTRLEGTIVAGVLDVRGQAQIEGSIITTFEPVPGQGPLAEGGNPATFNTTLGYFESTAGDSEAEMPDGGFGRVMIRYDPSRAMPDGITSSIDVLPELDSYFEGGV